MIRTQIPQVPPARARDRRGGRLHPRPRRRVPRRQAHRIAAARCSAEGYDAVFVGSGAPRGRDLDIPGRAEAAAQHPHRHRLAVVGVVRPHRRRSASASIVLGGGNTAMDCCRTSRRLGGEDVRSIVRSGFDEMKASPWEKEDAMHEGIPILNYLVPKAFTHEDGKLTGMAFEKVAAQRDEQGPAPAGADRRARRALRVRRRAGRGRPGERLPVDRARHRHRVRRVGHAGGRHRRRCSRRCRSVFFGGDAAFGPKNIIWAVAHGHDAAISIDKLLPRRGRHAAARRRA